MELSELVVLGYRRPCQCAPVIISVTINSTVLTPTSLIPVHLMST